MWLWACLIWLLTNVLNQEYRYIHVHVYNIYVYVCVRVCVHVYIDIYWQLESYFVVNDIIITAEKCV